MTEAEALALLSDPVLLEQHLNIRLVQLSAENSSVAIRAIELLSSTSLNVGNDELAGLTVGELQALEQRVTGWLERERQKLSSGSDA